MTRLKIVIELKDGEISDVYVEHPIDSVDVKVVDMTNGNNVSGILPVPYMHLPEESVEAIKEYDSEGYSPGEGWRAHD